MIEIFETNGRLLMRFQEMSSETYDLTHYDGNTFSWWMSYDEVARRGRFITDFAYTYYLIKFAATGTATSKINVLKWAWDPNLPNDDEIFVRENHIID